MSESGLRWVFPCTGNSGSTFVTKFMINAGIKCGHEEVFQAVREEITLARPPGYMVKKRGFQASSSCFATPYLKHHVARKARCVHVVRDPYKVVQAWHQSFGGIGVANYFEQWLDVYDMWPYKSTKLYHDNWRNLDWLAGICVQWNRMVKMLRPDAEVVRIEDAADVLMGLLGLPEDTPVPPRDTNTKKKRPGEFSLALEDNHIIDSFNEWAEENGYEAKAIRK